MRVRQLKLSALLISGMILILAGCSMGDEEENTTNTTVTAVRIEIHLSNGTELGPTANMDLSSGEIWNVSLSATNQVFDKWSAHVEVGASN